MISILVIDSNPEFLKTTIDNLSAVQDFYIDGATSTDDAAAILGRKKFDLIVASYHLQDMDGIALLHFFQEQGVVVPVVFYARHIKEKTIIDAMKHGAEFVLQLSDHPKAEFLELCSFIKKIVHQRQVEDALQRTLEDLRAIVTRNADAMVVLDDDGHIRFANPAAELLFNLPESELIGKLFGFPILLAEPVEMYILRDFRKFVAVEMRMVEIQWRGRPSYLVSMRDITWHVEYEEELTQVKDRLEIEVKDRSRDLLDAYNSLRSEATERKRAELALRESERRYRNIVELANEGIFLIDRNAVLQFVNPMMTEMLGYSAYEMVGRPIYDFVDQDAVAYQKYHIERLKQGIRESYDTELVRKDNTKMQAIINDAPLFDDQGFYQGSIAMFTDISQRKRYEEELREAKANAELYLDLMGHDIRNLAQIGLGYLELALESDNIDEIKELLAKPLEALNDASQIIDNVRKLQRKDQEWAERKTVSLCEILARLQSQYIDYNHRQITINLKTVSDCRVDANELVEEVFVNLINNSIKHSDPEKPLTIDIRVDRIKEKGADYLRCIVEDNGPGISNWVKDKIFMRFQRGDTKAHGKGLGLHIAKTLVEGFGGKIWVEDRVSGDYAKGARFVVVLPAVGGAEEQ